MTIAFIKSDRNTPVILQLLKMLPSLPNALSNTAEGVVFTLRGVSPEIVEISGKDIVS